MFNSYSVSSLPSANLQAEIYHKCRLENIMCILEYTFYISNNKTVKPDITIFSNNQPIAIIETKRENNCNYRLDRWKSTKQYAKYVEVNLPIFFCDNFKSIDFLIFQLKKLL